MITDVLYWLTVLGIPALTVWFLLRSKKRCDVLDAKIIALARREVRGFDARQGKS